MTAGQSVLAVDLHGLVRRAEARFGGEQLAHVRLHRDVLAAVGLRGGGEDHRPGGVEVGGHVGELVLDGLESEQRLPERDPGPGVGDGQIPGAPGGPDQGGTVEQPVEGDAADADAQPLADLSEQVRDGDAAVLEEQVAFHLLARHGHGAVQDTAAGGVQVDEEGAVGLLAVRHPGDDDREVGERGGGAEDLVPAQHVTVAVARRGGPHAAYVRTGVLFGEGEAAGAFAPYDRQEIALPLLVGGVLHDRADAQRSAHVAEDRVGQGRPGGGELLLQSTQFGEVQSLAAEFRRQADAVEAELGAALPDAFQGGPVQPALGGDAVRPLVGQEFVGQVGAQPADEVLEAEVVVVVRGEGVGHGVFPVQWTRRSAPDQ
ncbi:hypothetical protein STENM327S_06617 [Streptomyces tendae]